MYMYADNLSGVHAKYGCLMNRGLDREVLKHSEGMPPERRMRTSSGHLMTPVEGTGERKNLGVTQ